MRLPIYNEGFTGNAPNAVLEKSRTDCLLLYIGSLREQSENVAD